MRIDSSGKIVSEPKRGVKLLERQALGRASRRCAGVRVCAPDAGGHTSRRRAAATLKAGKASGFSCGQMRRSSFKIPLVCFLMITQARSPLAGGDSPRRLTLFRQDSTGGRRLMNEVMPASTLLAIGLPPLGFIVAIICIYIFKTEED